MLMRKNIWKKAQTSQKKMAFQIASEHNYNENIMVFSKVWEGESLLYMQR